MKESSESKKSEAKTATGESGSENEDHNEIDTNFLQELMKDDGITLLIAYNLYCIEKFTEMLVKTNDKAVNDIQAGNLKEALKILEKMEQTLEVLNRYVCGLLLYSTPQLTKRY